MSALKEIKIKPCNGKTVAQTTVKVEDSQQCN